MRYFWSFVRPEHLLLARLDEMSRHAQSQFYDLQIFCSDGLVMWNRFCFAMFGGVWKELMDISAESTLYMPDISKDYLENIFRKSLSVYAQVSDKIEQFKQVEEEEEIIDNLEDIITHEGQDHVYQIDEQIKDDQSLSLYLYSVEQQADEIGNVLNDLQDPVEDFNKVLANVSQDYIQEDNTISIKFSKAAKFEQVTIDFNDPLIRSSF